jgi:hypothetical protein
MTDPLFNKELIRSACGDGDVGAMADFSRLLLQQLPTKDGLVDDAPSNSQINSFAYRMLQRCHEHDIGPPEELVRLLQAQLGQDKRPQSFDYSSRQIKVAQFFVDNPSASTRSVAAHFDVARKTIDNWKSDGTLDTLIADIKKGAN